MSRQASTEAKVRSNTKSVAISLSGIVQQLDRDGQVDLSARSRSIRASIRVIVRAKCRIPEAWAMAVLCNNQRIDGIDWESHIDDHRGHAFDCKGWHRHVWSAARKDKQKECLKGFVPQQIEQFLIGGFKILNVKLVGGSRRDGELSVHQATAN